MLSYPPTRRALIVGCGLQMFQQLSGINTIMYVFLSDFLLKRLWGIILYGKEIVGLLVIFFLIFLKNFLLNV